MCLVLLAWQVSKDFPLVLGANRDEYFDRPTEALHRRWHIPGLLAGRDTQAGGTWLGMDTRLRIAAVTNVREPPVAGSEKRSRGMLPLDFLSGDDSADAGMKRAASELARYDGFNLVMGDRRELWFLNSRRGVPLRLAPGIHGISNGDLDCDWPKVRKGRAGLELAVTRPGSGQSALEAEVFGVLADRSVPDDAELPDTGVGIEWERRLAPAFVMTGERYGTRSSSVIVIDALGGASFAERTFDPRGAMTGEVREEL